MPKQEKERLSSLRTYDLLDTPFEEVYDGVVRLAAFICGTPVAAVSLIDAERQWFKSSYGLEMRETPRDVAFCAHTIFEPDLMVVPDATKDARFVDNPLVTGPDRIRFYAGAPLIAEDGYALGSLCVIDRVPRRLSADQEDALRTLARQVVGQMELARRTAAQSRLIAEREQAEAALRQSEARFQTAFAHAAVGASIAGMDGRFFSVNASLCGILGYTEQELLDTTFQNLTHPDDLTANLASIERLQAGELSHVVREKRFLRRDGSFVWLKNSVSLVCDAQNNPQHTLTLTEDITKRKAAEYAATESQERTTQLLSAVAALGSAITTAQVADVILHTALTHFQASMGLVVLLSEDGDRLRTLQVAGVPPALSDPWREFPVSAHVPLADAVRERRIILLPGLPPDDTHPDTQSALTGTRAAVPLLIGERCIGGLGLICPPERCQDAEQQTFLWTLAGQCALALERARLYDEARQSREEALTELTERQQTEQALQSSLRQLALILDNVKDVVFLLGVEPGGGYRFLFVNPSFQESTGLRDVQIIDRRVEDVLPQSAHALVESKYAEAINERHAVEWQQTSVYPSGERTGIVRVVPLFDEQAHCTYLLGTIHDVTDQERAYEAQRQSESLMAEAQRIAHVGSWELDLTTGERVWSEEMFRIYGLDPANGPPDTPRLRACYHPEDLPRYDQAIAEIRATGQPNKLDARAVRPNGEIRWCHLTSRAIRNEGGQVVRVVGAVADITDRVTSDLALRASNTSLVEREQHLRLALTGGWLGWWQMDLLTDQYLECSDQYRAHFDLPSEGLVYWTDVRNRIHPDDRDRVDSLFRHARDGHEVFATEYRVCWSDGSLHWLSVRGTLEYDEAGRAVRIIGTTREVTERKDAEAVLQERTEVLESVLSTVPHQVYWKDRNLVYLGCNSSFACAAGQDTPANVIGKSDADLPWNDADAAAYYHDDRRVLEGAQPILDIEETVHHTDGSQSVWLTSKLPLHDAQGQVIGVLGVSQDITGRHRSEQALRDLSIQLEVEHARLTAAQAVAKIGSWEVDLATMKVIGSAESYRIFEVSPSESHLTHSDFLQAVHPEDRQAVDDALFQSLEQNKTSIIVHRILLPGRRTKFVEERWQVIKDDNGRPIRALGTCQDITERQQAEEARERLIAVLDTTPDFVAMTDLNGRHLYMNRAARKMIGVGEAEDIAELTIAQCHEAQSTQVILAEGIPAAVRDGVWSGETAVLNRNGRETLISQVIIAHKNSDDQVRFFSTIGRDMTERLNLESEREMLLHKTEVLLLEAEERANHDPLTGLLNHRAFYKRLQEETLRASRDGESVAVAVLDLDNFKFFNDLYGHSIGDEVLRSVAHRLKNICRPYDAVSRFGGDEFALLLGSIGSADSRAIETRLINELNDLSFLPKGEQSNIPITLSVGVALFPDQSSERMDVVKLADARLLRAKTGGRPDDEAEIVRAATRLQVEGFSLLDALVTAVDNKDRYTRRHSEDVMTYALKIASRMGMSEEFQRTLAIASLLHDVGKIGVPDAVLRKPGRLTEDEFATTKQHPQMGAIIVSAVPGLEGTLDAIRHHHERWDGQGYPLGLRGEETPLPARIMAVADAYSAMTTDRSYRKGMSHTAAAAILREGAGTQWDAECVQAFLRTE